MIGTVARCCLWPDAAADLQVDDYKQIFAVVPKLQKLVLQNACQFKNEVMEYMIEKADNLTFLQLYAANLVSNEMWTRLFRERGSQLEAVKLQWLDASFDDETLTQLAQHCTKLRRLKMKLCRQLSSSAVDILAHGMSAGSQLEHLSLQIAANAPAASLIALIAQLGPTLRTLSLEGFLDAPDAVLGAIHAHCRRLTKLRFAHNDQCTDAAFAALFRDWANPALHFVDFSSTRDIDNSNPDGPQADPIGLGSQALLALLQHSGKALATLRLASCRHINTVAFLDTFTTGCTSVIEDLDGDVDMDADVPTRTPRQKQKAKQTGRRAAAAPAVTYPALAEIDISFCVHVDETTINAVFGACPALRRLTAFGCFNIEDSVTVPRGIVLIGVPRAQDAIEQVGTALVGRYAGDMVDMAEPRAGMVAAAA